MKNQLVTNKTRFTINTWCELYYGNSNSEFHINQTFDSSTTNESDLLDEIEFFVKKSVELAKTNWEHGGEVYHHYIEFEEFFDNEILSKFFDELLKRILPVSLFEIKCSDEILVHLNNEQRENVDRAGWWMLDKIEETVF